MVKWHLTNIVGVVYYFKYVGEVPLGLLFFCINLPSVMGGFFMEKMMIPDNYKPIRQVGNGNTVEFSFDFPLISENFVEVFREKDGVQSVVDSNEYSVQFDDFGGSVTFNEAPSNEEIIVITRNIPLEQVTPYKTSSGFPAVRIEENFDKLTAIAQQMSETLERCVKVEITNDQDPQELIDKAFEQLETAIEAGEQAVKVAKEAQDLVEGSKETIEQQTQAAVNEIDQAAEQVEVLVNSAEKASSDAAKSAEEAKKAAVSAKGTTITYWE
jgi:methyl-accepting chemotaxis protein